MVAGYEIYFPTIIRFNIHERTFVEMTTFFFPFLVQLLCDEDGMVEIIGVNARVYVMGVA